MRRIIGLFFILSAGVCLTLAIGKDKNLIHRMTNNIFLSTLHPQTLQEKVTTDLETLKKKNIPSPLLSLNQVFWQDHRANKKFADLSSLFSALFPISKTGKYQLQIDCFDSDDTQIIVQMSFFEQKTKNKVFEISRDYSVEPMGKN